MGWEAERKSGPGVTSGGQRTRRLDELQLAAAEGCACKQQPLSSKQAGAERRREERRAHPAGSSPIGPSTSEVVGLAVSTGTNHRCRSGPSGGDEI